MILNGTRLKSVKQELQMHKLCHELPLEYLTEESVSEYLSVRFLSTGLPTELAA